MEKLKKEKVSVKEQELERAKAKKITPKRFSLTNKFKDFRMKKEKMGMRI